MTKSPSLPGSIDASVSLAHETHKVELERRLATLNQLRDNYHEKLASALEETPDAEFEDMRKAIAVMIEDVNLAINQIIESAQTPQEAWSLIPLYSYNKDYLLMQDIHELPTLMSLEQRCRKRARQLGGKGNMGQDLYAQYQR